jgi:hypothetical protein
VRFGGIAPINELGTIKMKNSILIILTVLTSNLTFSQVAEYTWYDETCTYKSTFDSTKYTRQNISDIYEIAYFGDLRFSKTPSVHKLSDIQRLDTIEMHDDYQLKLQRLQNLDLPKNSIWIKFKDSLVIELDQEYELSKIAYKAYMTSDFTILKNLDYNDSDSCMSYYQKALTGSDSLISIAWEKLTTYQASRNGSPGTVWDKYRTMKSMEDWRKHAEVQIMTFGWWNCAVKHIDRFDNWKHYKKFIELFLTTEEIDCEEL